MADNTEPEAPARRGRPPKSKRRSLARDLADLESRVKIALRVLRNAAEHPDVGPTVSDIVISVLEEQEQL